MLVVINFHYKETLICEIKIYRFTKYRSSIPSWRSCVQASRSLSATIKLLGFMGENLLHAGAGSCRPFFHLSFDIRSFIYVEPKVEIKFRLHNCGSGDEGFPIRSILNTFWWVVKILLSFNFYSLLRATDKIISFRTCDRQNRKV